MPMPKPAQVPAPYDLHPSVTYVQAILANFKGKTGRTLEEWVALARREGPTDRKARQAWLKAQGLGTNQAGLVAQRAGAEPGHAFDDTPGLPRRRAGLCGRPVRGKEGRVAPPL